MVGNRQPCFRGSFAKLIFNFLFALGVSASLKKTLDTLGSHMMKALPLPVMGQGDRYPYSPHTHAAAKKTGPIKTGRAL
ncbi:hypothetical protein PIB30_088112, partial [Stylosanthes scabra]|nr:hypothetical protein [Stylosanthes scabra]